MINSFQSSKREKKQLHYMRKNLTKSILSKHASKLWQMKLFSNAIVFLCKKKEANEAT